MSEDAGLVYRLVTVWEWRVPALTFPAPARGSLAVPVRGIIINLITTSQTGKTKQRLWKRRIASTVKAARGDGPWDPAREYAVSVALRFHWPSPSHGTQPLDVENILKPVLDATAAGLFCPESVDPDAIEHWGYDDSNFKTLLIHRMRDASRGDDEGIALHVSSR